jgi:hypothetical protein
MHVCGGFTRTFFLADNGFCHTKNGTNKSLKSFIGSLVDAN